MAKITRCEKAICIELAIIGQYGDGPDDATDIVADIQLSGANNRLVIGSMTRKGLAVYHRDDDGLLWVTLTPKGYELGLHEASKFASYNEAYNINRQLNRP